MKAVRCVWSPRGFGSATGFEGRRGWWYAAGALLALGAGAFGCGGGSSTAPEMPTLPSTEGSADETSLADRSESEQAPPPPPPPVVVAGEHTPLEGPPPTLRILAPRSGQTIRSGSVQVRVQLRNWALESPEGRHVHLILDDEPYIALRDLSRPIDLNAVVQQNLGHELAEGTHVIRMFPSRGHHESVKEAGAFAAVVFHYRRATEGFQFDATQPLLTYSRPKGCNPADRRLLLDFYVTNATLAPDQYRVRWTLDGHSGEITSWVPHFIENLPEGEHTLQLTLIGPDGNPVSGPFNDSTRRFTVAATCP